MYFKKKHLVLIFILVIGFVLRFWKLGETPLGLYQDETAIGYNAYSILQTGRDEYGKFLPLYFKSFGDWKLPVYIYLTAGAVKLFGLTEFAVRLPSALFGVLTIGATYFLTKELLSNAKFQNPNVKSIPKSKCQILQGVDSAALTAAALLAVNPWHLHYSRAAFEVSLALFFFVFGSFLLLKAFHQRTRRAFFTGTLFFILALYTYNLTRLLAPILYLLIIKEAEPINKIGKREIGAAAAAGFVLLLPFAATFFSGGGMASASGTLLWSSAAAQAPLLEFRSFFGAWPQVLVKLWFNKWILTLFAYFKNIVSYFSVDFFFISGSKHGNHGIGSAGQFYLFELPLIVLGAAEAVRTAKAKYSWGRLLLFWAGAVVLIASLTREAPQATRSFFLILPMVVFSSLGFLGFLEWLGDLKRKSRMVLGFLTGIFIGYNLLYYFASYYVRFPIFYAKAWRSAEKEVSLYLKENESKYDKVIFEDKAGFMYSSLLFYSKYAPEEFQRTVVRGPDDSEGFSRVKEFGKYKFEAVNWSEKNVLKNNLVVTLKELIPGDIKVVKTFYYPQRPIVIASGQEIFQYPIKEPAYVLAETD